MEATKATRTLFATDLDRTMIYSQSAVGERIATSELLCVEYYNGGPLSYMTMDAATALRNLAARTHVVPATTRTVEQFKRVDLPGAPWRYAITGNGGNIIVDGVPDKRWRAAIDAANRRHGSALGEICAELRTRISDEWVDKFRLADDLFCYLVVRADRVPTDFLTQWSDWCTDRGWNVSQQGRKIYTMPTAVCKSRALAEVRSRLVANGEIRGDSRIVAAGDGGLDAEMLAAADAAIRPRHGELEILGWTHPTVVVTSSAGIVAAEQILNWFTEQERTQSQTERE